MKLGERTVGELELLINWLEYYGTPTLFISGDKAAIDEVEHLNCLKFSTKSLDSCDINFDYKYKALIHKLEEALKLERTIANYNNESIELKFTNDDYLDYLPEYDYSKKEGRLYFKDTIHLLELLYELSFILNAANTIIFIKVSTIMNKLRESYTFDDLINMQDPRINEILNMDKKQNINKKQRDYLIEKFGLNKQKATASLTRKATE